MAVDKATETLRANGKIATLRRARKVHTCTECKYLIPASTDYYEVIYAGSGLGGTKHPDRVHIACLKMNEGGEHS